MKNKNSFIRIISLTSIALLIPLIAMQFSDDVHWSVADFIFAATFFIVAGLVFEFLVKKLKNKKQRIIAGVIAALFFAFLWAEFAVGIFTNLGS